MASGWDKDPSDYSRGPRSLWPEVVVAVIAVVVIAALLG